MKHIWKLFIRLLNWRRGKKAGVQKIEFLSVHVPCTDEIRHHWPNHGHACSEETTICTIGPHNEFMGPSLV